MKKLLYGIVAAVVMVTSLSADIKIIVKAAKERAALVPERTELASLLAGTVQRDRVRIVPSPHPVWKWRLGVVGFQTRESTQKVLASLREHYPDAYLFMPKADTHPKRVESRKRHQNDKYVEINFSDLTIAEFIRMVSKITGQNILVPKEIDGKINFTGTKPIHESELMSLLNQILLSKGYALVDSQRGFLNIVKSKEAIRKAPPLLGRSKVDTIQTAILPFKNLKSLDLMKQVKSLVSSYGRVTAANSINSLIVTDYPQNIASIKSIIDAIDRSSHTAVRFIKFKNNDVDAIYAKAGKLVRSFFDSRSKEQQIHIIKNENANTLVLVGNREDINKIVPYIRKLDEASARKEKDIELVYIKNTDAESVVKLLTNLMSNKTFQLNLENMGAQARRENSKPVAKGKGAVPHTAEIPAARYGNFKSQKAQTPNISFDKHLNAVILFGTRKEREVLKKIIAQIDVEREQVYVQAKVLEINNDKASEIGMQYGIVGGVTNSSGLYALSNKMGLDNAGAGLDLAKSLDIALPNASTVFALGAAVSLLEKKGAAKTISEPSVLCINNEASSLYVGKTVSVVSQSSVASTTTDISRNTYSREDIGLTLKILPRISSDHKVSLGVEISSEDILPGSPIGLPKTTKRVIKTSAIVKNGEMIILGGMVKEKESKVKNGIPILSNIPLLGKVFKYENVQHEQTTLVVMLIPYIVEKSGDLGKLREALGKLHTLEEHFASQR